MSPIGQFPIGATCTDPSADARFPRSMKQVLARTILIWMGSSLHIMARSGISGLSRWKIVAPWGVTQNADVNAHPSTAHSGRIGSGKQASARVVPAKCSNPSYRSLGEHALTGLLIIWWPSSVFDQSYFDHVSPRRFLNNSPLVSKLKVLNDRLYQWYLKFRGDDLCIKSGAHKTLKHATLIVNPSWRENDVMILFLDGMCGISVISWRVCPNDLFFFCWLLTRELYAHDVERNETDRAKLLRSPCWTDGVLKLWTADSWSHRTKFPVCGERPRS